jgi:hypothetical protein
MSITGAGEHENEGRSLSGERYRALRSRGHQNSRGQGDRTVDSWRVMGKGERWLGAERDGKGSARGGARVGRPKWPRIL